MKGSRGALFKVRLSSHGYTLVAKGMEKGNLGFLKHERYIYDLVRSIQRKHVPVCLGSTILKLPYYEGDVYIGMLLGNSASGSITPELVTLGAKLTACVYTPCQHQRPPAPYSSLVLSQRPSHFLHLLLHT